MWTLAQPVGRTQGGRQRHGSGFTFGLREAAGRRFPQGCGKMGGGGVLIAAAIAGGAWWWYGGRGDARPSGK